MGAKRPCAILLHGNLLYAEVPLERIPILVQRSYLPVLRTIRSLEAARVALNFSGYTLELLNGEHPALYEGSPEAVALLRELVAAGRVEITGTSWAHAILPILPPELAAEDISLFRKTAARVLDVAPDAFFPPEMATAPFLPGVLTAAGYRCSFIDADLVAMSRRGDLNDYNEYERVAPSLGRLTARAKYRGPISQLGHLLRVERHLVRHSVKEPFEWLGTGGATLAAIPCDAAWLAYSLICLSRVAMLSERRFLRVALRAALASGAGLLLPYFGDIEFFGYGGNTIKEPIPVERLELLLRVLAAGPATELVLPGRYARDSAGEAAPGPALYVKSGSWSSQRDFALWQVEPDNAVLNNLCTRAWELFREKEGRLDPERRAAILKTLLLAWNSDGRGWTPIAEHRLFCFDRALEAQRLLLK